MSPPAHLRITASLLAEVARYPEFSREFEAMTYDKGAMILRMLRWQIGDTAFQQTLHEVLSQADKSISSARLEEIAESASHENLRSFFAQWLDNTGAPTLQDKWTLYRLGNNQGFRTVGEIDEDLDLFQMPVEVQVETEGKTVNKRVDVMGPQTQFTIDTFGIPAQDFARSGALVAAETTMRCRCECISYVGLPRRPQTRIPERSRSIGRRWRWTPPVRWPATGWERFISGNGIIKLRRTHFERR